MSTDAVLQSLQGLLSKNTEGLATTEIQIKIFQESKLQVSYKTIENVIFKYPSLFVDVEGKWKLRA